MRFAVLLLLLLLLFVASLLLGSVYVPPWAFWQWLRGLPVPHEGWAVIVLDFRLPKALTAVLAGAGLSVCGLQMQTLFRNPLAGPYVLGITSGAGLGVALVLMAGQWLAAWGLPLVGHWHLVGAAVAGAGLSMLLVLGLAFRLQSPVSLLIVGLMMSSMAGAVLQLLEYFTTAENLQRYALWGLGALGGNDWPKMRLLLPVSGLALLLSVLYFKPLNVWWLGDVYARSLGVNVRRTSAAIIVLCSIQAGVITAFCGPIGFVGLAVPHLARLWWRTADHRVLLPGCALLGAVVLLACDLACHAPLWLGLARAQVLPINAVTSLLGAPLLIWLVMRRGGG